jgi:hypothetical protein
VLGAVAALCALVVILPAGAQARVHHVSIIAVPNPIDAGDPVAIVGHLTGPNNTNRQVNLFHRLPNQFAFTFVQSVRTDAHGNYLITRGPGVVDTNRSWFVRSLGAKSRTVHERVHALVTLNASTTQAKSNQPVLFTGHVTGFSCSSRSATAVMTGGPSTPGVSARRRTTGSLIASVCRTAMASPCGRSSAATVATWRGRRPRSI